MLRKRAERPAEVTDYGYSRTVYDVGEGSVVSSEDLDVTDDMDFLGGIGRSFKILANHQVRDPFRPESPLVINTGCLTGTAFMTGLRTYFSAYSPLKRTRQGAPMAAWSAMSGSFGRKLVAAGVGDLVLTGAAGRPSILVIKQTDSEPEITLEAAPAEMLGKRVPEKMAYLNSRYNDGERESYPAQFVVIGPAGEHWQTVWYAAIVGSTQEMVMSGEDKFRFGGRLGMGSVLGSKNILGIVVIAHNDVHREGDERMKAINHEIGRGEQSRGFRHPNNRDGLGGTGKNEKMLDGFGVLPWRNFESPGENLATPVHIETMRDADEFIVIDRGCFGCEIACHMDFYETPSEGKDPDPRKQRRKHGDFLGRYEFEPMELAGPNIGILDPRKNLELARLDDDLGFDTISVNVLLSFVMDYNARGGDQLANGLKFGDATAAARTKEDIAYGREPLLGKGVKAVSEAVGGSGFAMHCKGVEHSAYLAQTNPGYPFAVAGGHMSMRTFLLYVMDPNCEPASADYWVDQITQEGWKCIAKDMYGGCLFTLAPPDQVAKGIQSIFGVPMTAERLLGAAHKAHLLGFALEQRQGADADDYGMAEEVFVGNRKGDLPGAKFLTKELFLEIRDRALARMKTDAEGAGYGEHLSPA
jgi:aldehyde:ferredoxin oxidoreductase